MCPSRRPVWVRWLGWPSLLLLVLCTQGAAQSTLQSGHLVLVGSLNYCASVVGTDSYACSLLEPITEYNVGARYTIKADVGNTDTATLQLNSISGPVTLRKLLNGALVDLVTGDICAGQMVDLLYDGTYMQLQSPSCALGAPVIRSISLNAGSFDVNGGCTLGAAAVLLTSGPKTIALTCTDSTADSIETHLQMPDGWNAGTLTVQLIAFSIGNNTTEVFEMSWIAQCVSSGDSPAAWAAVNHTTDPATSITWGATANRQQMATSGALTPSGTCAGGDHLYLKGEVDATATTMVPMTDLKILEVKLEYTRSAGND